jgi:hypothetical protein
MLLRLKLSSFIILVTVFLSVNGCGGCSGESDEPFSDKDSASNAALFSGLVELDGKTFGVPSSLQISEYITETSPSYSRALTNNPDNYSAYITPMKQALNLGVYTSDFSYIVAYQQISDASRQFASIKFLIDELNLSNAMSENILSQIEKTSNKDSLIIVVSGVFTALDEYLIAGKRSDISALVITGAWVESMYLLCTTLEKDKSKKIFAMVADQKYVVDNILDILKPYYGQSDEFDRLFDDLVNLAYLYDGVTYNYTFVKPKTDVENKLTVIKSVNEVIVSDYHINSVKSHIQQIRARIVSTKSDS